MSDLAHLKIWDDPAIRDSLSWYLDVAENRRPAKFRIAATLATHETEVSADRGQRDVEKRVVEERRRGPEDAGKERELLFAAACRRHFLRRVGTEASGSLQRDD